MILVFSPFGILIAGILVLFLVFYSNSSWAGALSLPAITIMTGILYFYIFPSLFLLAGGERFFGLSLDGLVRAQFAMALYMIGAFAAFWAGGNVWRSEPSKPSPVPKELNPFAFYVAIGLVVLTIATKYYLGELSIGQVEEVSSLDPVSGLKFLNLAFSAAIPLVLYGLIKSKYSVFSIVVLAFVLFVFLLDGFRFRLVILCSGVAISYCYYRNFRPGMIVTGLALLVGMFVSNVIELTRTYGQGIDLDRIEGRGVGELVQGVGGEIGPVFVLTHLTSRASDLIQFDPWVIAIARLVPSFLWPGKPYPAYLKMYSNGFPDERAISSGVAGTQHAEFYMQFGWLGLPFLSFGFFMLAIWLIRRLRYLSAEARLAGMALIPSLFGFYAQQRGYTFQLLCEITFTILPLFLIHLKLSRSGRESSARRMALG